MTAATAAMPSRVPGGNWPLDWTHHARVRFVERFNLPCPQSIETSVPGMQSHEERAGRYKIYLDYCGRPMVFVVTPKNKSENPLDWGGLTVITVMVNEYAFCDGSLFL